MENKNKDVMFYVLFLVIGLFIGWGVCSSKMNSMAIPNGMHQMPNGEMMQNSGDSMQDMMQGMMMGLEGKTGEDFDQAFLSEMIMHHEGAVVMAQAVLENSNKPELIKLAKEIISAQTKEIEMMKGWQEGCCNK